MHTPENPSKILVFLPKAAGATIVSQLAEKGYVSLSVSTISEAFDALRSDVFAFAITTRPDIDVLRNIHALPVINLEVFFHADIAGDGSQMNSKRFDTKAFLERVEFLALPTAPARSDIPAGRQNTSQLKEKSSVRWWVAAANALPLTTSRGATTDVHS